MIKFFRNIRHRLIKSNRISKYFLYAVGEIFLVVIGILIALQVNEWHQNRERIDQEQVLLLQLKKELLNIYSDLWFDYEGLILSEKSHFVVVDHMEEDLPYDDTLCFYFYWLKQDDYIYPERSVYDKIKQEGLDIINNDSIRTWIQTLYETHFPRISREKSYTPDISEYLDDYYINHFRPNKDYSLQFSYKSDKDSIMGETPARRREISYPIEFHLYGKTRLYTGGVVPLDYEKLKRDYKFQMMLSQVDDYRVYKLGRYEVAIEFTKKVITEINEELLKRKN